ncbi:MFS transporter [Acidiphilium sp. JA12-A1]|uniref:MFS transporter n=1 Tax=Acidiphilium sp. JA12-A1 TaxID=1464546 RepID=UPI000460A588|nr:MFS transporter [Acidiphilium sp. JA12-A1]KDM66091.1 multidrug resistance protein Stp [Acidiphilium sp. JA12-A1]
MTNKNGIPRGLRARDQAIASAQPLEDVLCDTDRPKQERWVSGRAARVLLCASGVSFMIMLDSNIVAVSLPAIARNLNAAFTDIEWVVSAYILTFAALLMPAGALADRFGRRRLLTFGLVLFTLASLLCGLAPTTIVLNAARALQGIGAAIQLSAALAVLGHTFRGPDRSKAFAFWGTVIGVAVALGPLVGGLITSAFGWRYAFFVNVPVGIGLLLLALASVEESSDPDAQRLDLAGMALFGTGLFALVWALIDANGDGWSSRPTVVKLVAASILLCLYVVAELVQRRPMVDFGLFRKRTFLGSSFAMLGFASAAQVMMTYLPLYLQNSFGYSPAEAGVRMLPFALPLFFFPRVAAALAARISGRMLLTIGLVIVVAGNLLTAVVVATQEPFLVVAIGMVITGCGAGLLNGETAKVSMSVIPPERSGMASGIGGTLRFVGLVTGITGLGAILTDETQHYFLQAAANAQLGPLASGTSDPLVSRIIAGDLAGVVAQTPVTARDTMLDIGRLSFGGGFSAVLLAAAAIAAISALLTVIFVDAADTAPHRSDEILASALEESLD